MIDSGMDIMIIKTCACGLDPKKHCGMKAKDLIDHFRNIVSGGKERKNIIF